MRLRKKTEEKYEKLKESIIKNGFRKNSKKI